MIIVYATSYTLIPDLTGEPLTLYKAFVYNHITSVCEIYPLVPQLQVNPSQITSTEKLTDRILTIGDKKSYFDISKFRNFSFENTENDQKTSIKASKPRHEWTKRKHFRGYLGI